MGNRWHRQALIAGLFLGYIVLDRISFIHPFSGLGITPWNPPSGWALALLVVYGLNLLPVLLAATLASDLFVRGLPVSTVSTLAVGAVITLCYGAAAHLLRHRIPIDRTLARLGDVFRLVAVAAAAALMVAILNVAIFTLMGELEPRHLLVAATRSWIGDVIGVVVVAPLVLVHPFRLLRWSVRTAVEVLAQGLALFGVMWLLFGAGTSDHLRYFYLLFLPLIWIAARFGLRGATLGNLAAQVGLVVAFTTVLSDAAMVTDYQFRMLALAVATLLLGAAVSGQRRAEGILRARQDQMADFLRLSMAGEMAAVLAHEINQPLMATIAFSRAAQRLLRRPKSGIEEAAAAIDKAVAQAERAGAIIRTLREFIGHGTLHREPQSLGALVAEAAGLAQPECSRRGVRLTTAVDKAVPPVHVDGVQVQQVMINLIRNGMDAMAKLPRARREIQLTARYEDGWAVVEVRDHGDGLQPEMAERLFRPFNTTKPTGMGLGLSISRTIVEAHGGKLWLAEDGPGGCVFRFTLPTTKETDRR